MEDAEVSNSLSQKYHHHWIEYDTYWLFNAPQLSEPWFQARKGRDTGSKVAGSIGHNNRFTTPEKTALEISGKIIPTFSPEAKERMQHGVDNEPVARQWYESTENVTVEELGLVVPRWNSYIGVSVDGLVRGTDGIIEIKCPKRMYDPLNLYMNTGRRSKPNSLTGGFDHIWQSHYDQMQFGMAILNKKWCEYIVFCTPEDNVFHQKVPWNQHYWDTELYPKLTKFIDHKLKPLLVGTGYPIMPPKAS